MKCYINDKEYNFIKNVRENEPIRKSFNSLAQNTFCIDFESWYQNGYWGDDNIPYVLMDGDKVVSNISVNIINTRWQDTSKLYIQLGTVMSEKEYWGKGLNRWLMEKVLEEWSSKCDAIYLFANDSVLNFYPRFGFEISSEYQYKKSIAKKAGIVRKLDMSIEDDKNLLLETYKYSNPFSALPMEGNDGLLMFYCSQYMRENIYYIEQYNAVVIAEYADENLVCYDIFCPNSCQIDELLCIMAHENTKVAILGFTPKHIDNYVVTELKENDTTLFILKGKENLFKENKIMFPLLSHS